jgi:hypothetical protein
MFDISADELGSVLAIGFAVCFVAAIGVAAYCWSRAR